MKSTTVGDPASEAYARQLDEMDPLRDLRSRFHLPLDQDSGNPKVYFCGNSLGLQPRSTSELMQQELDDWARFAVDGHFKPHTGWYRYHELLRDQTARLVGATADEVVVMNSLTVNLHLMMVTFFRPDAKRYRILMEAPAFPSDIYAIKSHLQTCGLDPDDALLTIAPREDEHTIRMEDLLACIEEEGERIALILLGGVNYYTGQVFDLERIASAGHERGCVVGFDLAHAAGNVPLSLHDWNVDFACWCSYKYLNAGPGALAGCFIHERHASNPNLPRYGGWWGNDPESRFRMHLQPQFIPRPTADGWQISNPPIFSMVPLRASMNIFDEVGMKALREKSQQLTGYLRTLIDQHPADWFEVITPTDPREVGCQLSILVHDRPQQRFEALQAASIVGDFRQPNVIRVAPIPLYNTFEEVHRFVRTLGQINEHVQQK